MNSIKSITLLLSLFVIFANPIQAGAKAVSNSWLNKVENYKGEAITQDKNKITHLVFFEVWSSYGGQGDEQALAELPQKFLKNSQKVWIQPQINVTRAQLEEFQGYFQNAKPLVLDKNFSIMQSFGVWQSPFHILIENEEVIFSGDMNKLTTFVNKKYEIKSLKEMSNDPLLSKNETFAELSIKKVIKHKKPLAGELAPTFSGSTLAGDPIALPKVLRELPKGKALKLVFLDALCPMPQFPGCEEKIVQLNKQVKLSSRNEWLAVINSYYVDENYVQGFINKFDLHLPILFDRNNTIYKAYDVYASPYLIKINSNGVINSRSDKLN